MILSGKVTESGLMKIHRLMLWVLLAVLLAFAANYLAAQLRTKTTFVYVQDKTKRLPNSSPAPPSDSAAKTTSSLLIKPPFRISETSTINADRRAGSADVAFNPDDNEYLVVWESNGLTQLQFVNDIYGRRISGASNERIGIDFRISSLSDADKHHSSKAPKVVYNNTADEYLVVWHGSGLFDSPDKFFEVYGQRLSRTGKAIGSSFQISYTTNLGKVNTSFVRGSSQPHIAWNNTNNEYLVVWKGMGEPEDVVKMEIYGQRLKANGELLGKYFRISHTTEQGNNFHANAPAIACNSRDNQYLVVWSGTFKNESQAEIFGMGLSATGKALARTNDLRISQVTDAGANRAASSPHVVYNSANNEYFVVFQANALRGEGNAEAYEVFGQRIDAGTLAEIGPNDFRVSNSVEAGNRASEPAVVFNSVTKEYLVIWQSIHPNAPYEIFGKRISSGGTKIEADFQISNIAAVGIDRIVESSSLTHHTGSGDYFVVWQGNGLPGADAAKITEIFGQGLTLARSRGQ